MKALVYTAVHVLPESPIEVDFTHAVRVGEIGNDLVLRGHPADLERLAAALMLAATNIREEQLVAALSPSGQPSEVSA